MGQGAAGTSCSFPPGAQLRPQLFDTGFETCEQRGKLDRPLCRCATFRPSTSWLGRGCRKCFICPDRGGGDRAQGGWLGTEARKQASIFPADPGKAERRGSSAERSPAVGLSLRIY